MHIGNQISIQSTMTSAAIKAAPLDDPLYYLRNAEQVISLCRNQHADLLTQQEADALAELLQLPEPAQALLMRMVMRKGELFRRDGLTYAEVPDLDQALVMLSAAGWVSVAPLLTLEQLCQSLKRPECLALARHLRPDERWLASHSKAQLVETLLGVDDGSAQPVNVWWPQAPVQVVKLCRAALFDRLRLMFFGNLRQHWSEFVVTELQQQRFEEVPLTAASRPFHQREEVDLYLHLADLETRAARGEALAVLGQQLPDAVGTEWLDYRRQRVLFRLGREAERRGESELALALYAHSQHRDARVRALRLKEKSAPAEQVYAEAVEALAQIPQPETRVQLQRILQRSARKAGLVAEQPGVAPLPQQELSLPPGAGRVEKAVIEALSNTDWQLYHVENSLFTGVFALLFWPVLFAPVRGAFFHPFQAGPADLFRPGFVEARQGLVDQAFKALDDGRYRQIIRERLTSKQGIRCSLVHWPTLTPERVEAALACIPAADWRFIFEHLLLDLRHHSRGLPDLIAFNQQVGTYQLIEVKGPGDRLQDHQRLWLNALQARGVSVSVCHVRWQAETAQTSDDPS